MKGQNTRFENGLISHADIAPTILDLAGLKKSERMPGKSFLPVVCNEKEAIHEAVYGENNFDDFHPVISEVENPASYQSIRSKFVRTKHYKYIRYHECHPVVEELWKISEDTLETHNLINDPEYEEVAEEMRNKLDDFENQYVDYWNTLNK